MATSLGDAWDISRIRLPGQSVLAFILSPRTVPKVSVYRPDYLFRTVIGVWGEVQMYFDKLRASRIESHTQR